MPISAGSAIAPPFIRDEYYHRLEIARWMQRRGSSIISVADFGVVGDGVTDDTAAIQAAITYAETKGTRYNRVIIYGAGNLYAVSSSIDLTAANGVILTGFNFKAIGTWAASTTPLINLVSASGTIFNNSLYDVTIDCNFKCSGISISNASNVTCEKVFVLHFLAFGIKTTTKATELTLSNCEVKEWLFGESGEVSPSLRIANGYDLDSADFTILNSIGAYCLRDLIATSRSNGQIIGSHFYSGSGTSAIDATIVESDMNNLLFDACYFDNGRVLLTNMRQVITNSLFALNSSGANPVGLELRAQFSAEDLAGLVVTNNLFTGYPASSAVALTTATAGSFASSLRGIVAFNIDDGGGMIPAYGRIGLPNGTTSLPGVAFGLDVNTGFINSSPDTIDIVTGGGVKARIGVSQVELGATGGAGTRIRFNTTSTVSVGAAGAAQILPANPAGYTVININGTDFKIPYYNV